MRTIVLPCVALVASLGVIYTAPSAQGAHAAPAAPANSCARLKTSGWKAWLNTMPGPGATRTLHVRGMVTVPTTGWRLQLVARPLLRPMPPTQAFALIATPPGGHAGQIMLPQEVKGEVRNALPHYRRVSILCGRTTIATMPVSIVS